MSRSLARPRNDQRAARDRLKVLVHERVGPRGVALRQCGDNRTMFADCAFRRMRPAVEGEDQAAAGGIFADIARRAPDCRSFRRAGCGIRWQAGSTRLIDALRLFFVVDMGLETLDLGGRQMADETGHHECARVPRRTSNMSRASFQLGVATAAPRLRRSSTSPSAASWPSTWRTIVRLAPKRSPIASSGSLAPGAIACSMMACRKRAIDHTAAFGAGFRGSRLRFGGQRRATA